MVISQAADSEPVAGPSSALESAQDRHELDSPVSTTQRSLRSMDVSPHVALPLLPSVSHDYVEDFVPNPAQLIGPGAPGPLNLTDFTAIRNLVQQRDENADEMPVEEEEESDEDDGSPRIIIIEELDTPATRREKNMRKKEEKLRREAEAAAMAQGSAVEPVAEDENVERSVEAEADVDVDMDVEQQSDLTSLGDPEDDDATIEALLSGSLTPVDQLTPGGDPEHPDEPAQDVEGPAPDPSATSSIARPLKGKRKGRSDSDRGRPKFSEGKEFLPGGTLGEHKSLRTCCRILTAVSVSVSMG